MSHIFFIVEVPPPPAHQISNPPTNTSADWQSFEWAVDGNKPPTSSKSRVSRNVWLLDAEGALPSLVALTSLADKHGLQYKAFLVSGEVVAMSKPNGGASRVEPLRV